MSIGFPFFIPQGFIGFSKDIIANKMIMSAADAYDRLDEIIQECDDKNRMTHYLAFDKYESIRSATRLHSIREGNTVYFHYKQRQFIRQPKSNVL